MSYEPGLKQVVLDVLLDRMSSIAGCILLLNEEGYIPNKSKQVIINWSSCLIAAYKIVDTLTEEQQRELDNLCNKILRL